MKKKVAAILAPALIAGSLSLGGGQAYAATDAVIVKTVNFREGPSTSADRIRYLKAGEEVDILSQPNKYWYKVRDSKGTVGYVSALSKYIRVENESSGSKTGTIVNTVNFRKGPSTSADRIRYLKAGEKVTILGQPNKYWYKVRDSKGTVGYISALNKYINVGNSSSGSSGTGTNASEIAQKVINAGMKYLGTPYEFGSDRSTTTTFDCSDFVRQAYKEGAGITLPYDSRQQAEYVKKKGKTTTDWRNLKPGDIMFFMSYKGPKKSDYAGINKAKQRISHNGIYIGDGKILHTYSKESGGVRIDSIAGKHWEYRFVFGGSPL